MLGCKSKHQAKDSAKLVVLTGRNPQRYLEWEAQALHAIKSRSGKIGIEHWQGRQPYTVGERQEEVVGEDLRRREVDPVARREEVRADARPRDEEREELAEEDGRAFGHFRSHPATVDLMWFTDFTGKD